MIAKHYPIPSHVADYLQSYFNKYISLFGCLCKGAMQGYQMVFFLTAL